MARPNPPPASGAEPIAALILWLAEGMSERPEGFRTAVTVRLDQSYVVALNS